MKLKQTSNLFYYAILLNEQEGPFTEKEFKQLISEEIIDESTFIWRPGLLDWTPVYEIPDLKAHIQTVDLY